MLMSGYRVLIHAVQSRMWYVKDFLVPSLESQGILPEIVIDTGRGNLRSCMDSFMDSPKDGGTWHLQDDVIICRDFGERIKRHNKGLVLGFHSGKDNGFPCSFPCIRIPNDYARKCAEWFFSEGQYKYPMYARTGKMDDTFFRLYLEENPRHYEVLHPCLVDHIDFLIGGSVCVNVWPVRAAEFDKGLVDELQQALKKPPSRNG